MRQTRLQKNRSGQLVLGFMGDYNQVPPMYSALKINGKKLYELAREGKTIESAARRVQILDIEILEYSLPRVHMEVHCFKRNLYPYTLPRYRAEAWMWWMYGITYPYKGKQI